MFSSSSMAIGGLRAAFLLALWSIFCPGAARADVMTFADGRRFDSVSVDSFTNINGRGIFQVRAVTDGVAAVETKPVEASRVASIEFHAPAASGQPSAGRRGILFMAGGEELESVWVERFGAESAGPGFRVRQTGLDAGSPALPLAMANIARIYLGPPEALPLAGGRQPLGLFSEIRPRQQRFAPTPAPASPPPAPEDTYDEEYYAEDDYDEEYYAEDDYDAESDPEAYHYEEPPVNWTQADADLWLGGSLNTQGMSNIEVIGAMQKRAAYEAQQQKKRQNNPNPLFSRFSSPSATPPPAPVGLGLRLFGLTLGFLSIIASIAVTVVAGGIMLFLSSRAENITDFPLWKAIITAVLLSIFPLAVFLVILRYVPFFGLWLGLAGAYFTARAILMGMMEVLEDKATSTLIGFFLIQFGVLVLMAKFL